MITLIRTQNLFRVSRQGVYKRKMRIRRHAREFVKSEEVNPQVNDSLLSDLRRNPISAVLDRVIEPDAGYEMALFPLIRKVKDTSSNTEMLTEERKQQLRDLATKELKNIDVPEQTRRKIFGTSLLAIVFAIDAYLVFEKAGFWPRFATTPLLAFGVAYLASGQLGLCNIAQNDMWQVDGMGLTKIKDESLAKRIRQKVNTFNATTIVIVLLVSVSISLYPLT